MFSCSAVFTGSPFAGLVADNTSPPCIASASVDTLLNRDIATIQSMIDDGTMTAGPVDLGSLRRTEEAFHDEGLADENAGTNTTIGVIATNARLDKNGCLVVAQGGHDGMARALFPPHTTADGDALVAAATQQVDADLGHHRVLGEAGDGQATEHGGIVAPQRRRPVGHGRGEQADGVLGAERRLAPGAEVAVPAVGCRGEDDVIAGLVVEDPFRMGYEGIKTALAASKGEPVSANVDTGVTLVTKANMSSARSQELLKPNVK